MDLSDTERGVIAEKLASYWNWRSEVYAATHSGSRMWSKVFLTPFEGAGPLRLLDMGTGPGFLAVEFAGAGHDVTGMDLATDMLNIAKNRAAEKGLAINFIRGNAVEPPSFADPFDGVTCRNLLWTLPDPLKALKAWRKLLRPGGRIVIADGNWDKPHHEKDTAMIEEFRRAYSSFRQEIPFFLGLSAQDGADLLEEAGFSRISRYDQFFDKNPYEEYQYDFFVMSAVNPE